MKKFWLYRFNGEKKTSATDYADLREFFLKSVKIRVIRGKRSYEQESIQPETGETKFCKHTTPPNLNYEDTEAQSFYLIFLCASVVRHLIKISCLIN